MSGFEIFVPMVAGLVAGVVLHELGHAIVARLEDVPVLGVHIGMGRELVRRGRVVVHAWPVAVAVALDGDTMRRLPPMARAIGHLAGPLANVVLAAVLMHVSVWAAFTNVLLAASNIIPLPKSDGGWAVTAFIFRGVDAEMAWHDRWFAPVWIVFLGVVVAGLVLLVTR